MNTLAMKLTVRPTAETLGNRGGADPVETLADGAGPFGAVLGALTDPASPSRGAAPALPGAPVEPGPATPAGAAAETPDPLGILTLPAPAEPAGRSGRGMFDALVARAVTERPPVGAGGGTVVAPPAPSADAVEGPASGALPDPAPSRADARDGDTSAPERPDPVSPAGVSLPMPSLALPSPAPTPQRGAGDDAAAPAFPNPRPAPSAASAVAEARMRVTVLRQETHFAPVAPRSVRAPVQATAPDGMPAASDPFEVGPVVTPPGAATPEPTSLDPRIVTAPTSDAVPPRAAAVPETLPSASAPGIPAETVIDPPADPVSQEDVVPEGGPDARGPEPRTRTVAPQARQTTEGVSAADLGAPPVRSAWPGPGAAGRIAASVEAAVTAAPSVPSGTVAAPVAAGAGTASADAAVTTAPPMAQPPALVPLMPAAPRPAPAPSAPAVKAAASAAISGEPVGTIEPARTAMADLGVGPHQPAIAPSATEAVAPAERDHGNGVPLETVASQPAAATATQTLGAAPLSGPAAQIAEVVVAEAQRAAPAQPGAPTALAGADGPLRILTLQLRPMDLGNVVVRMRLRGNQLEMSLHASREDTAELLRKDGALLGALLRDAGYQPDAVAIGAPMETASTNAPPSGQTFQPGSGGQNPARDMSDQPARRQPDARAERTTETRERTHETHSAGPDRSGVYL